MERYARWKSNRLALDRLPAELFCLMASFLCANDFANLVCALTFTGPILWRQEDVMTIPPELRCRWVELASLTEWEWYLRNHLAEHAYFHCRDGTSVIVLVDWSQFKGTHPEPVAEYAWRFYEGRATTDICVHHKRLQREWSVRKKKGLPSMRITLHTHFLWNDVHIVNPRPVFHATYPLFPHFLLYKELER